MDRPTADDAPRPSDDTGVLPADPGTGTTDTQLFREITSMAEDRADRSLPSLRSPGAFRLLVICLALAAVTLIVAKLL